MPVVTVELPSGKMQQIGIDEKTTLRQVALMLELKPENTVFFGARDEGVLGTLIGPANDNEFGDFNTTELAIVDKTKISAKNTDRFNAALKQGWGGGTRRRHRRRRSTRRRQ